jgi:hypothetical protein
MTLLRLTIRMAVVLIAGLCLWQAPLPAQGPCDSFPAGGTLTGIVNSYYPGSGTASAGATSITVGARDTRGASTNIAAGDMLLVIQMQDADISYTNSNVYGDGTASDPANGWTALNSSGLYEYVVAQSAIGSTGGTFTLTGAGTGNGLLHTYRTAASTRYNGQETFQVIRVPQYRSATLGSSLTAPAWNGGTGGVLAVDVSGTLTFGGTVNMDGKGFRGGGGRQLAGDTGNNTDYQTRATRNCQAPKGEGIAGTPLYVWDGSTVSNPGTRTYGYPSGLRNTDGSCARGAPGNAGGGGTDGHPVANDENSGGGGGGNGGIGGRGGHSWSSNLDTGGHQAAAFPYAIGTNARIAMGGGGGGGTRNNSDTITAASSGGLGGGIVLLRAYQVAGTGTITANGTGHGITAITPENDGGGGGGAGGTIVVVAPNGTWTGLSVQAQGGGGVDAWPTEDGTTYPGNRHGPGGGGGGGVVLLSGTPASISVTGGTYGTTTTSLDPYGATAGAAGASLTNVTVDDVPGVLPCNNPNAPSWARIGGVRIDPDGRVEFAVESQRGSRAFRIYETWEPDGRGERTLLSETPVPADPAAGPGPVIYRAEIAPVLAPFLLIEELECGGTTRWLGPFFVGDRDMEDRLARLEQRLNNRAAYGPWPVETSVAAFPRSAGPVRALKIEVDRAGIVRVPVSDLVAAGMPADAATIPEQLQLTNLGRPVAFQVTRDDAGAARLEFTASLLTTDYTAGNVYVIGWGAASAPRPSVGFTKSGFPERPDMLRVEENHFFAPFIARNGDPWIWSYLSTWFPPDPLSFDLPAAGLPVSGSVPVRIGVSGGSDHHHTIEAWLNGQRIGQVSFAGKSVAEIRGVLPAESLRPGGNQLTFTYSANVAGPDDGALAFVDIVDLGFRPLSPTTPVAVRRIAPYDPELPSGLAGTDYLILTHPLFAAAADRIATVKGKEYHPVVIDVERAYDRYSGGVAEPNAVAALIAEVWRSTNHALRFVLLIGDDTYDPRDFTGTGQVSFIPSLNGWDGSFGRIPSENRFADPNGDGVPEIAIGRLPVVTPAQADIVADKIAHPAALLSGQTGGTLQVMAVDDQGPGDISFYDLAAKAAEHLPGGRRLLWANVAAGAGLAHADLLAGLRNGAKAVHFFGHGSFEFWTDNGLLTLEDMAGLAGSGHAAVVFSWTCEAQWYPYGNEPTINEALLLVPAGGAIACVGPTGITDPALQQRLSLQLYDNLRAGMTLGEALRAAKEKALQAGEAMRPVIDGWCLLGDPALRWSIPTSRQ